MRDYSDIGLSQALMHKTSPLVNWGQNMSGINFDTTFDVQTNRVKTSNVAAQSFVQFSDLATASGVISLGSAVTIETILTPDNLFSHSPNFADVYVAVYEGTSAVGSMIIYPFQGEGVSEARYEVRSGFSLDSSNYNGTNSVFDIYVERLTAGTSSIYVKTKWKYIQNNFGQSAT